MAQASKLKALPLLPPKPTDAYSADVKIKNMTNTKSSPENHRSEPIVGDCEKSVEVKKHAQVDPKQPRSTTGAATRTKTVDRLMTILEESPSNDLHRDVDMVLSVLERMSIHNPNDVVPQTEMVVRIYNLLEKVQKDRLMADPKGTQVSKEETHWEREIERRLRML